MEEEAEKLKELQAETEKTMGMQTSPQATGEMSLVITYNGNCIIISIGFYG